MNRDDYRDMLLPEHVDLIRGADRLLSFPDLDARQRNELKLSREVLLTKSLKLSAVVEAELSARREIDEAALRVRHVIDSVRVDSPKNRLPGS